jgi:3-deoxy-7-phosphoheptulonate synthase
MLLETAAAVKAGGAALLRGGAFKPRTSPYDFQGLGEEALRYLAEARAATGLPVVTEVRDVRQVELVARYADMFQIGARNMQNFDLLREVGRSGRPVLLKRGIAATLGEFLMAAEYVLAGGNANVVLCERGIRSVADEPRFTLDVAAVPLLQSRTHLPVIVDPSHAAGRAALVPHLARAAVAAGADGLIIEVHHAPERALCDGSQSLLPEVFARLAAELGRIRGVVGVEAVAAARTPAGEACACPPARARATGRGAPHP